MPTIIHNTTIVTADEQCTVHYDAAIAIAEDRIAALGPNAELLAQYPAAERIDGRGKAVMPGFANVHTHLGLTLARGIYEDLSPSHTPPFEGGLAPLPLPPLSHEERQGMCQLGMLEAMRSGTTLVLEDAVGILHYAERHGYEALGVPDAGWLAPGNKADLIMVDLRKAHLVPLLRVVSCFVHQGQGRDVEAVMVDGRWLMRDGRVHTLDEETIVREADRIGRAAWRRLFEERPELQPPPGLNRVQ